MKALLIALALSTMPALAALDQTPLAHTDKTVTGQTIVAPDHPTVIATLVTFQPGDKTPPHQHPWPHYGYVLEGVLTVTNSRTGESFELKAGQFLVEMQNTTHVGENKGKVPVKILIVDTVPQGVATNTIPVQP